MALVPTIRPKHVNLAKSYAPSAALFGAGAFVTLLFFTNDWKGRDLLQFIPWYNRRYDSKEE